MSHGPGSDVTSRFITRQVDQIARVQVLSADGQTETLEGTTIHPIWSLDRDDWVELGELDAGEQLSGPAGPATVLSLTILNHPTAVYNIEVHGQHVYQVGGLGVLVHNACNPLRPALIRAWGDDFMEGMEAAHIIPKNGWKWAPDALRDIIDNVKKAGLIDDVANGFASSVGHAATHTKAYVDDVIDIMDGLIEPKDIVAGINKLWKNIKAGKYE